MLYILRKFGELTQAEFGTDKLNMEYEVLGHFKRDTFETIKHIKFVQPWK